MQVNVCLGDTLIPKYLDFCSSYSAPRIARIYSEICSGIYSYSGIIIPNKRTLKQIIQKSKIKKKSRVKSTTLDSKKPKTINVNKNNLIIETVVKQ